MCTQASPGAKKSIVTPSKLVLEVHCLLCQQKTRVVSLDLGLQVFLIFILNLEKDGPYFLHWFEEDIVRNCVRMCMLYACDTGSPLGVPS